MTVRREVRCANPTCSAMTAFGVDAAPDRIVRTLRDLGWVRSGHGFQCRRCVKESDG